MHFSIQTVYTLGKKRSLYERDRSPRIEADVLIHMEQNSPLGWPGLSARLFKSSPQLPDALPPLYDVRLESMVTLGLLLIGVEVVEGRRYPQAWHCRPLDGKVIVPWTAGQRSSLDVLI